MKYFIFLIIATKLMAFSENFVFDTLNEQRQFEGFLKEFRCVTCPNQSIADSNAPVAKAMQQEIYTRLKQGESMDSIRGYLHSHYGDYVLYKPQLNQKTLLLWCWPFIILIIGTAWWKLSHSKNKKTII